MTLTQIKPLGLSKPVDLADNEKIRLGTSNDLQIYHSGAASIIANSGTGSLYLQDDGNVIIGKITNAEVGVKVIGDAASELYYDNSMKLATTSAGVSVTGHFYLDSELNMTTGGNKNRFIDGSCDDGEAIFIRTTNGGDQNHEYMASFYRGGAVELYHNTSKKFETTSSGAQCTGYLKATGGSGYGFITEDNVKFSAGNSNDLQIYHDGTNSAIKNLTNRLDIYANTFHISNLANSEDMARFNNNGSVELYYDYSKKLETSSSGVTINAGARFVGPAGAKELTWSQSTGIANFQDNAKATFGSSDDLQIYHDGSHSRIVDAGTGVLAIQGPDIRIHNEPANELMADFVANGAASLYYDNLKMFETIGGGCKITGGHGAGLEIENGGTNLAAQFKLKNTTVGKQYTLGVAGNTGANGQNSSLIFRDETANVTRAEINTSGHFLPGQNNTYDLGSSSRRWRNVYTGDLQLSNEGHTNDVDGTWGNCTIQEGESDLFLKNNRSCKKYKFNLTEVS